MRRKGRGRRGVQDVPVDGQECLLCKKCAEKHEHGKGEEPVDEGTFLPVVNSPRMGMCGYTGDDRAWK